MVDSMILGEHKKQPILRNDGKTYKGTGWLGIHKTASGKDMTEYSIGVNIDGQETDIPMLVPGLTPEELDFLKTEPDAQAIPKSIMNKAIQHAFTRLKAGKSPFNDSEKYYEGMTNMVIGE